MPDASKQKKGPRGGLLCCFRSPFNKNSKQQEGSPSSSDLLLLLGDSEEPKSPLCPESFGLSPSELQFADEGELVALFERPRQIPNIRKYCLETLMKIRP